MRFKGVSVFLMLFAALTFISCGGDDNGATDAPDADSLSNAANTTPTGTLTSNEELSAAVEGLLNGGNLELVKSFAAGYANRLDVNAAALLSKIPGNATRSFSIFAQSDGSECVSGNSSPITVDFGCIADLSGDTASGTMTITWSGTGAATECTSDTCYLSFEFNNISITEGEDTSTLDGVIAMWTDGSTTYIFVSGTFGFGGEEIAVGGSITLGIDELTGYPTLMIFDDGDGNVFVIDDIVFTSETTGTFTVTDSVQSYDCAFDDTGATCTGL